MSPSLPLSRPERFWSLAAAIACVGVFGFGVSFAIPLFSLILEARHVEAKLIGLNAAASYLGVITAPLLVASAVRALGMRPFILGVLCLYALVTLALKLSDSLWVWFGLRILVGMCGSALFTASETWINGLAGDADRGRILGLYGTILSLGFATGPLLISLVGMTGWIPFLALVGISAVAALPVLRAGHLMPRFLEKPAINPLAMPFKVPLPVLAVALFGLFESTTLALLPVWGIRAGFGPDLGAASLTAIYSGALLLQVPIGWISDRVSRGATLRFCGVVAIMGAVALPFLTKAGIGILFPVLLVWGGVTSGIYPIALSMIGDRFRGADLIAANAALITFYGIGSLAGPALGGLAMDLWNPHGLPMLFVLAFGLFLAATLIFKRSDG
ncbi:MAG TPA: MFS transporter [Stellaceae bacterium]|nr:MFS transporter [Stellaceae bacterium]